MIESYDSQKPCQHVADRQKVSSLEPHAQEAEGHRRLELRITYIFMTNDHEALSIIRRGVVPAYDGSPGFTMMIERRVGVVREITLSPDAVMVECMCSILHRFRRFVPTAPSQRSEARYPWFVTTILQNSDDVLLHVRSCPASSSVYECDSLMMRCAIIPARMTRVRLASAFDVIINSTSLCSLRLRAVTRTE